MARYIDADKADVERISCFYGSECRIEDVKEWLDEQPTADVVEVVRCKDCKNRNGFFCPIEKESATAHWFEDEDYCSFGERKENK